MTGPRIQYEGILFTIGDTDFYKSCIVVDDPQSKFNRIKIPIESIERVELKKEYNLLMWLSASVIILLFCSVLIDEIVVAFMFTSIFMLAGISFLGKKRVTYSLILIFSGYKQEKLLKTYSHNEKELFESDYKQFMNNYRYSYVENNNL